VKDAVPHGGPIVAVLGAVGGVPMFFVAVAIGSVVTAVTTVGLISLKSKSRSEEGAEDVAAVAPAPAPTGATAGAVAGAGSAAPSGDAAAAAAPAAAATATALLEREVLSGYLTPQTVREELAATSKEDAIREMAEMLAATGKVADKDALIEAALAREAQGTTGLGEEIAIPHAKTDAVTAPVVGFARSAEGIDWGSLDGTSAKLVFMISVPEAAAGDEHLRILALLSRKLMDGDFRARLQAAPSRADILDVLAEVE
jgi:fructose PTS system EIIBC or EIIC component